MTIHVEVRGIRMEFGDFTALDGLDLGVVKGEFLSILGPSGCGKTTLLNIIAGFLTPTFGAVVIGGAEVTDLPPNRRDLGMVFQSYALFPHMTVAENVSYGLSVRKVPKPQIEKRVAEALDLVQLSGLGTRRPRELSGGQQQRVAIARALAIQPKVLLMDEPLSNLDAKLRREMRVDLKQLQHRVGVTTMFVTHDQEEALTLSDRIVVMNQGQIEQIGTPTEIYRHPSSRFVAQFIGQANIFSGEATRAPSAAVAVQSGSMNVVGTAGAQPASGDVAAMIRPERVRLSSGQPVGANAFPGTVDYGIFVGSGWQFGVRLDAGPQVTAIMEDAAGLPGTGEHVWVQWNPADVVILPDAKGVKV